MANNAMQSTRKSARLMACVRRLSAFFPNHKNMQIRICKSKIHHATVTKADLYYVGSITIDEAILKASDIKPYQYVLITNLTNGVLWQTYVMKGAWGGGQIELNGPPAHHFALGDKIIVLAEGYIDHGEPINPPTIVFVGSATEKNPPREEDPEIKRLRTEGKDEELIDYCKKQNRRIRIDSLDNVTNPETNVA